MDITSFTLIVISAALVVTIVLYALHVTKTRKLLQRQAAAIQELQQTRQQDYLRLVESTLNPHLFKNILNSIQSHAYQTYFALDKLANVLDYILYDSRQRFVTPKEELQFALDLIEINRIKLSPLFELQIKTKIDDQDTVLLQKVMAPLISIDLIENAFKHAELQRPDSFIMIAIELRDGIFALTVTNRISDKPTLPKDKTGIGSPTLDQRLKLIYPDRYELKRIKENDQFIAHLKINLRGYEAEMHSS